MVYNNIIIVQVRYFTIDTTDVARSTTAFTLVRMLKKKPVISSADSFFYFNSTVSYTCWSYHNHDPVMSLLVT